MQLEHLVLEVPEHPFHLMVTTLDDAQASLARSEDLELGGQGGEVFKSEIDALLERLHVVRFDDLLGLDVIDLGQLGGWLRQSARPLPSLVRMSRPVVLKSNRPARCSRCLSGASIRSRTVRCCGSLVALTQPGGLCSMR